jgi:broad-specificity NMP kinase
MAVPDVASSNRVKENTAYFAKDGKKDEFHVRDERTASKLHTCLNHIGIVTGHYNGEQQPP